MRVWRSFPNITASLLGCALLMGCAGGSGSSGFDISPSSENAAIELAIEAQRCVDFEGLIVCPAEAAGRAAATPTPPRTETVGPTATAPSVTPLITPTSAVPGQPSATPTATATPGAPAGPAVELDVGEEGVARCFATEPGLPCALEVPFTPRGFDSGTVFRVAIRTVDAATLEPSGSWRVGEEPTPTGAVDAASFEAVVSAVPGGEVVDGTVTVQLAVLAFPEPPNAIPEQMESLAESGAQYAFVAPPVRLEPL